MPTVAREVLKDYKFCIERQVTWGTAIDTSPLLLPTDEMFVELEAGTHTIPRTTGNRWDTEGAAFADSSTMIPKVTFRVPATPEINNIVIPWMLQKNADYAAAANVWTYIPQAQSALPAPRTSTTEGYFYTLTAKSPIASKSIIMKDAICTSLKLMVHHSENQKMAYWEVEAIGRGYSHGANPSGTIGTTLDLDIRYPWIEIDHFTVNGTDQPNDFVSMETTISYGAKFQNDVPTGEIVFPELTTSGNFVVCGNANTEALKTLVHTSAVDNAIALLLQWGDGTISAAGEWNTEQYIRLTKFTVERREGEVITFEYVGLGGGATEFPFKSVHYV